MKFFDKDFFIGFFVGVCVGLVMLTCSQAKAYDFEGEEESKEEWTLIYISEEDLPLYEEFEVVDCTECYYHDEMTRPGGKRVHTITDYPEPIVMGGGALGAGAKWAIGATAGYYFVKGINKGNEKLNDFGEYLGSKAYEHFPPEEQR